MQCFFLVVKPQLGSLLFNAREVVLRLLRALFSPSLKSGNDDLPLFLT